MGKRSIGVCEFLAKKFEEIEFEGKWADSFGLPEKNFSMFRRVYYNSFEQGVSKSLQDALKRNNMEDAKGRIVFGNMDTLQEMYEKLSVRNSPQVVFIDSRDYMEMTRIQFAKLKDKFPHKAFIIVCWRKTANQKGITPKKCFTWWI